MIDVNISLLDVSKVIIVCNVVKYLFYGKREMLNHFNLIPVQLGSCCPKEFCFLKNKSMG